MESDGFPPAGYEPDVRALDPGRDRVHIIAAEPDPASTSSVLKPEPWIFEQVTVIRSADPRGPHRSGIGASGSGRRSKGNRVVKGAKDIKFMLDCRELDLMPDALGMSDIPEPVLTPRQPLAVLAQAQRMYLGG